MAHEHNGHCNCEGEHLEEHTDCTCNHEHHTHHHDGCCEGHEDETECLIHELSELSEEEYNFLSLLYQREYLPVAQFVVLSSTNENFASVALFPIYLESEFDTMAEVKARGKMLLSLENRGAISLDCDIVLGNFDYSMYENCELYKYFCSTVKEATLHEGFVGDTPTIELGSIAMSEEMAHLMSKR